MDQELNGEGGSGGSTAVCSDQLFDACGAELVLDLPDGGVVSRAQPRSSSIAQLSERLRGHAKVRRGALAPHSVSCEGHCRLAGEVDEGLAANVDDGASDGASDQRPWGGAGVVVGNRFAAVLADVETFPGNGELARLGLDPAFADLGGPDVEGEGPL